MNVHTHMTFPTKTNDLTSTIKDKPEPETEVKTQTVKAETHNDGNFFNVTLNQRNRDNRKAHGSTLWQENKQTLHQSRLQKGRQDVMNR